MATIDRAIMIASIAHAGQKDKADKPYILHPSSFKSDAYGGVR